MDRFLVSEDFRSTWNNLGVSTLDRKLSDHCPLVLKDGTTDFGPKPFRIFDTWLEEEAVQSLVFNAWKCPVSSVYPDCIFRDRLKNVKSALKTWSKNKVGKLDGEIDLLRAEVSKWEALAETENLETKNIVDRMIARKQWIEKKAEKSKMARQKSRIKWDIEGDANTRFFHASIRVELIRIAFVA